MSRDYTARRPNRGHDHRDQKPYDRRFSCTDRENLPGDRRDSNDRDRFGSSSFYRDRRDSSGFDRDKRDSNGFGRSFGGRNNFMDQKPGFSNSERRDYGSDRDYSGRGGFRGGRGGFGGSRGGGNVVIEKAEHLEVVPNTELVQKLPGGKLASKSKLDLNVNCFSLDLRRAVDVYLYDLEFVGIKPQKDNEDKKIPLYQPAKNDYGRNLKNSAHSELFDILQKENETFFKLNEPTIPLFVYDRGRILYSTACLMEDNTPRQFTIDLTGRTMKYGDYVHGMKEIQVTLRKTGHLKNIGNPETLKNATEAQRILTYLDLLIVQRAVSENKYHVFGPKIYLQNEQTPKKLKHKSKFYDVKSGMSKGTKVIGGPDGKLQVVLQIDTKFNAFYHEMSLTDFIEGQFRDFPREYVVKNVKKLIKGLVVRTKHRGPNKESTFWIADISDCSADKQYFNLPEGGSMSVADFIEQKYHYKIRHKHWPCVVQRSGKNKNYFPIDVLDIAPGQRVDKTKMDPDLNSEMLRTSEQKPSDLRDNLTKLISEAQISMLNPDYKMAGIRIDIHLVKTSGVELYPPSLEYGDEQVLTLKNAGRWNLESNLKFYQPAEFNKIAVLCFNVSKSRVEDYMEKILKRAGREHGMTIEQFSYLTIDSIQDFDNFIRDYSDEKFDFLFLITGGEDGRSFSKNSEISHLHQALNLSEINHNWATEHILEKSLRPGDTTKNILMKMNCKKGGINKILTTNPELLKHMGTKTDMVKSLMTGVLIIGVEFSSESPSFGEDTGPSCVGFVSNTNEHQINNGDYFYVEKKAPVISSPLYSDRIEEALRKYNLGTGHYPKKIVIYRSGASTGQLEEIADKEVDLCRRTIEKFCQQFKIIMPSLIYASVRQSEIKIVGTSINDSDPAVKQNVRPGTTIPNDFSKPHLREFTFVGHSSQLGTAKTCTVTVLYPKKKGNEPDMSDAEYDHFVQLTNYLCYTCDAVNSPISVPGPCDSAEKVAQRGIANYRIYKEKNSKEAMMDDLCEKMSQILRPKLTTAFWT